MGKRGGPNAKKKKTHETKNKKKEERGLAHTAVY